MEALQQHYPKYFSIESSIAGSIAELVIIEVYRYIFTLSLRFPAASRPVAEGIIRIVSLVFFTGTM